MKKYIFTIIILSLLSFQFLPLRGQQNIQVALNDTIQININSYRGTLQWQVSYDSLSWNPVTGQVSAALKVIADSFPVWYRLAITEDECEPWYSEQLKVTQIIPFVCGNLVSHGYVIGVTPDNSLQFANRTYSTVQAGWTGAGGNKCWLKMNLGATTEASTATDPSTASAGWFFQFNRQQAYFNDGVNRIPNTPWINPINENSDWVSLGDPCKLLLGGNWRIPTQAEWNAFLTAPIAQGGVGSGYLTDAYASTLKIHAGGNLGGGDGLLQNAGNYAYFWSSGQNSNNTAGSFRYSSAGSFPVNSTKNFGYALRCILD